MTLFPVAVEPSHHGLPRPPAPCRRRGRAPRAGRAAHHALPPTTRTCSATTRRRWSASPAWSSAAGTPSLVLPRLEEPLARHALGDLADELQLIPWDETDDPSRSCGCCRGTTAGRRAGPDVVALRPPAACGTRPARAGRGQPVDRRPAAHQGTGGDRAAACGRGGRGRGDGAHHRERLSGRTEAEVSHRISELLLAAGHDTDFAIVGSGPNSASPHHEPASGSSRRATPWCSTSAGRAPTTAGHDPHRVRG